jgi:hypothetical protein
VEAQAPVRSPRVVVRERIRVVTVPQVMERTHVPESETIPDSTDQDKAETGIEASGSGLAGLFRGFIAWQARDDGGDYG